MHLSSRGLAPFLFFALSFLALPFRSTASTAATVVAGQAVTLSVTSDGTSPFTYQWYRNSQALGGATGASYVIASAQPGDAGDYHAVVANSAGSTTSDVATLAVAVAPAITSQPVSQSASVGATVSFTATASGNPAPALQWRKNGQPIAGATAATFVISGIATGDAGAYSVVVSNLAGSATSNDAVLTVLVPPAFVSQPVGQTVNAGATVTLSASASGSPLPTYQWRRNGVAIPGATASAYTISNAAPADTGTYTVVATNVAGTATSAGAVVTVQVPPVFVTQPASQSVAAGTPVTFTALASGMPSPTYQWRKNGAAIAGATGTSYTIASVAATDAATYSVVATNAAGTASSAGAALTLRAGPVIVTHPASQTVAFKASATFAVSATGSGQLTYQWYKNGAPISKATGSSYRISRVTGGNEGVYSVVVSDTQGSTESHRALLVIERTPPPLAVRVDFNRDGRSDIVFENAVTGERMVWLMLGTTIGTAEDLGVVPVGTEIAGTGDFNADGHSDLIEQDRPTGERGLQLMTGTNESGRVSFGFVAAEWELVAAGEFNGDSGSDLVWQNSVTGERRIRLMNGTTPGQEVSLGVVSVDWEIRGSGDFNGDRRSDLVWQNIVTGECRIWLMAGTSLVSVVTLGQPGPGWNLAGCGDFNADTSSDLLWENAATGERMIQLMTGTTPGQLVSLGVLTPDWFIRN